MSLRSNVSSGCAGRIEVQQTGAGGYDDRPDDDAEQSKHADAAEHADDHDQTAHFCAAAERHDQTAHFGAAADDPGTKEIVYEAHNDAAKDREQNARDDVTVHDQA